MASDEIINEIWEIAQENSLDPIDKEEFGKDLRKTVFAELERSTEGVIYDINNEFARALPIILHQAKANPDLIYENNGKGFSVASGILAKAVLTVKYENRYIPGTAEYQNEFPKESVAEIVLTAAIADSMIKNFDQLSYEERSILNENWSELTHVQRKNVIKSLIDEINARTDIDDNDKKTITESYEGIMTFEDFDAIYDSLPPEEQAKAAELFLQNLLKTFPNYQAVIESLEGESALDIVTFFRDNIRNLNTNANQTMDDLKFKNLTPEQLKDERMEVFAEIVKNTTVYNISMQESLINLGVYEQFKYQGNGYYRVQQKQAIETYVSSEFDSMQSRLSEVAINLGMNYTEMLFTPEVSFEEAREKLNRLIEIGKAKDFHFKSNESGEVEEKSPKINPLVNMIEQLSNDEVADLFGDELKELLSQRAEELGLSDDDKKILEAMMASKDDDSFADLFYEDRDGFIQELEEMVVAQQLKKIPVTDQEYSGTYRSTSVDMAVDEPGLEAAIAQIEAQKKAEAQTELDSESDSTDTSSDTTSPVQNDNEVGEGASVPNKQPVQGSFIMTARREDSERDTVDGEGAGETSLEDEAADSIGNTNNSKANFSNFKNVTQKFGPTTDMLQEMGNTVTTKLREQDSPELANDNGEVEQEEIE